MPTNFSNNAFGVMLVSGAIALGVWVGVAAAANGPANSVGALRSSSQHTASPTGGAATEEIKRGIRDGLAAGLDQPQP
jgi:hypothetical protein